MKVGELISMLEDFNPEAEVRIGAKGFRGQVEDHAITDVDTLDDWDEDDSTLIVYILEGQRIQ